MKVPRVREVIEIQIFRPQLEDGSRVGENAPPLIALQDYGQPGFRFARHPPDLAVVHAPPPQPLDSNLPQRIIADLRYEADTTTQRRQIVRNNRRGAPQ